MLNTKNGKHIISTTIYLLLPIVWSVSSSRRQIRSQRMNVLNFVQTRPNKEIERKRKTTKYKMQKEKKKNKGSTPRNKETKSKSLVPTYPVFALPINLNTHPNYGLSEK